MKKHFMVCATACAVVYGAVALASEPDLVLGDSTVLNESTLLELRAGDDSDADFAFGNESGSADLLRCTGCDTANDRPLLDMESHIQSPAFRLSVGSEGVTGKVAW
jgi:hypothetical protein